MTDRTTELLRKLLDKRGVEWLNSDGDCCDSDDDYRLAEQDSRKTTWSVDIAGDDMTITAHEVYENNELQPWFDLEFHEYFTPEQAATLGNDDDYERKMDALLCRLTNGKWSKSRAYDLDFMEQCVNEEFETLYSKELANAELGNGTLTAEQVREAIEANSWAETSTIREFNDSSWQAIADELNAELRKAVKR